MLTRKRLRLRVRVRVAFPYTFAVDVVNLNLSNVFKFTRAYNLTTFIALYMYPITAMLIFRYVVSVGDAHLEGLLDIAACFISQITPVVAFNQFQVWKGTAWRTGTAILEPPRSCCSRDRPSDQRYPSGP